MGSYVEEFQDDSREKESELVITIDGASGAGKGTLARHIAELLDISYYSAGDFFRNIADEKGMTVEELSEKADKETDIEVDRRTLEKGLKENCIIESRIASWILGGYSDFKIHITADPEERAKRILQDLENRDSEEGGSNLQEAKEKIQKRDRNNDRRYQEYYGIDTSDLEIYDLMIDNTDLNIEEQNRLVKEVLAQVFPGQFED